MEKGAEKAGVLMKMGSEKLRAKLNPEENPKQVDPRVQKGIQYVRVGSHAAVKVSSFIGKDNISDFTWDFGKLPVSLHLGKIFKNLENKCHFLIGNDSLIRW